jgi:hypothetical protein
VLKNIFSLFMLKLKFIVYVLRVAQLQEIVLLSVFITAQYIE